MSRRAWSLFLMLAAFWGASYLFIKVCLNDGVPPAAIVFLRVALAALVLVPFAAHRGVLGQLRGHLPQVTVLGFFSAAAPFLLITVGERHLPSALTGILVATAPIFTFLLAFVLRGEQRASALSLAGVALGIVGVGLLLGVESGGSDAIVGGLMVVVASLFYGIGAWYLKRTLAGLDPTALVAGAMTASTLLTLPLLAIDPPALGDFELDSLLSVATLGLLGTGAAFAIFYFLIGTEGPAKASLVAYVAPAFSLLYGVTILDEAFTAATAAGLVLIVGGSWLAAEGRLPWRPRSYARAAS